MSGITNLLNLGAGQTDRPEVPENQVVLSTVSLEPVTVFEQDGSHGSGVGADLLGVLLESGVGSLLEGDGDTGDGVVVGTTLTSREDGSVDTSLKVRFLVLSEEDETSSGTTEGLVGSGGHDVTVLERRVLLGSSDETRDVGHVGHEVSALAIGDLSETAIVPVTGVSGTTANEKTGLEEVGVGLELGVVNDTSLGVDSVRERLEVDGRSSDLLLGGVVTVGEVTTVRETKTHHSVLGADEGSESGKVGGGTRVRLDVHAPDLGVKVESLQSTLPGKVLNNIDVLVTTVVSSTGKTLRVLVGKHRAVGLHNSERSQVLGSDKLETRELTPSLLLDERVDLGIGLSQGLVETSVKIGGDGDGRCHSDLLRDSWADGSSESGENKPGHMDRFKKRKKKREKGGRKRWN